MNSTIAAARTTEPRDEYRGPALVRFDEAGLISWASCGDDRLDLVPTMLSAGTTPRYRIEPVCDSLSVRRRRATREAA